MKKLIFTLSFLAIQFQFSIAQTTSKEVLYQKVDSLINQYFNPDKLGMAVAIIEEGNVIYSHQIGMANLEYNIPITDSTAFHIASVSKQFTSYLAVSMAMRGELSMEDDVREHLPELAHLPYKISLNQLANHTHGLPNVFELAHLRGFDIQDRLSHDEVIDMLLNIKQINFQPGTQYEYNNTGFALLAEVIERVSDSPFQEVLKEEIFTPLEMNNSLAVSSSEIIIRNKAYSYKTSNSGFKNHEFNNMTNGSSGISTTINDLSKWAIYYQYADKRAEKIFHKMQKPTRLSDGTIIEYGLGLEFKKHKGLDIVFHGGGDAGYRSYLLHIPKHDFSIAILANSNDFSTLNIAYGIVDLFMKDHLKPSETPKKVNYITNELKSFEGTYEFYPGKYFNILAEKDTLFFQSYGTKGKAPLPVIGDGEFLFPYVPFTKFSFYDNGFIFNIADFKYDCKKVTLNPPSIDEIDLEKYIGLYKNDEFNTTYELVIKDNQLVAVHSLNNDIILKPLAKDSFYGSKNYFAQIDFVTSEDDEVIEFLLSGQNLKDIQFSKIK
ncbi:serine hydrolase domain-containing protein [Mangrovivirga cuniculi]|uniref:Beta-lactamase-related domain-containing protein n=1 Tax=Mangrovivirga cuniculi TaxID=2715131 RepID=A0A4D7K7J1_9BACT|nr:serine hydrolase domain-containing protein [Mangrovivirga cuniculi]QCK16694.1 hypothetical protein DCC35_19125 [Mangrovivirga cuniculi]